MRKVACFRPALTCTYHKARRHEIMVYSHAGTLCVSVSVLFSLRSGKLSLYANNSSWHHPFTGVTDCIEWWRHFLRIPLHSRLLVLIPRKGTVAPDEKAVEGNSPGEP
jgi:hypothetical protein